MRAAVARHCHCGWPAVAAAGLILGAALSVGCESTGGGMAQAPPGGPPSSPVQHPLLENIPLPVGFQMVPERSVARQMGELRLAQCEFEGPTRADAVVRFYVEYLPTAKFTLRQQRFDNGEYSLRFESDKEECNVRVRGKGPKTVLVIDIAPLSRTGPEGGPARPAGAARSQEPTIP